MARTKASVGAKVSSGKSSKARCSAAPPPATAGPSGSGERSRGSSGGNPVCPRETPVWQRPITNFFACGDNSRESGDEEAAASSSKLKPKKNIIHSDEEDNSPEKPKNKVLDETIELEPLTGEDSHKIEEYYSKNGEDQTNALHLNGVIGENGDESNQVITSTEENAVIKNGHNGIGVNGNGIDDIGVVRNGDGVNRNSVKGKGVGKKTKGKENKSTIKDRKRERDGDEYVSDGEHAKKKIKVE